MKYLKVIKRGTSRSIMVSADGEKWLSIEEAYGLDWDKNFEMEFYALDDSPLGAMKR